MGYCARSSIGEVRTQTASVPRQGELHKVVIAKLKKKEGAHVGRIKGVSLVSRQTNLGKPKAPDCTVIMPRLWHDAKFFERCRNS